MEQMETKQLLSIWIENDNNLYTDETFKIIREILAERDVDLPAQKQWNYCPACTSKTNINKKICKCGYNFVEPNIDEMDKVRRKRSKYNRLTAIVMIASGGLLTWKWFFLEKLEKYNWMHGIPILLIIFGIYYLFIGDIIKTPTKSPFDYILGDPSGRSIDDDIPYIFCHSCKKQLLLEMKYKKCPYCNATLRKK